LSTLNKADIQEYLKQGAAVVALESTHISHGPPRLENLNVAREAAGNKTELNS
jgi:pseudouridine-5'-phosphate glycosidase